MYDQDDFDIELAEKETEIARVVREVTVRGMSQLAYDEAELIHGGIFNNIDRRRLTAMPSNTQRQIALEAIYAQYPEFRQLALEGFDWKKAAAIGVGISALAALYKLIEWIMSKVSGYNDSSASFAESSKNAANASKSVLTSLAATESKFQAQLDKASKENGVDAIFENIEEHLAGRSGESKKPSGKVTSSKNSGPSFSKSIYESYGYFGVVAAGMLIKRGLTVSNDRKEIEARIKFGAKFKDKNAALALLLCRPEDLRGLAGYTLFLMHEKGMSYKLPNYEKMGRLVVNITETAASGRTLKDVDKGSLQAIIDEEKAVEKYDAVLAEVRTASAHLSHEKTDGNLSTRQLELLIEAFSKPISEGEGSKDLLDGLKTIRGSLRDLKSAARDEKLQKTLENAGMLTEYNHAVRVLSKAIRAGYAISSIATRAAREMERAVRSMELIDNAMENKLSPHALFKQSVATEDFDIPEEVYQWMSTDDLALEAFDEQLDIDADFEEFDLALEAFDWKRAGIVAGGLLGVALLVKIVQWIREKFSGGGGLSSAGGPEHAVVELKRTTKEGSKAISLFESRAVDIERRARKSAEERERILQEELNLRFYRELERARERQKREKARKAAAKLLAERQGLKGLIVADRLLQFQTEDGDFEKHISGVGQATDMIMQASNDIGKFGVALLLSSKRGMSGALVAYYRLMKETGGFNRTFDPSFITRVTREIELIVQVTGSGKVITERHFDFLDKLKKANISSVFKNKLTPEIRKKVRAEMSKRYSYDVIIDKSYTGGRYPPPDVDFVKAVKYAYENFDDLTMLFKIHLSLSHLKDFRNDLKEANREEFRERLKQMGVYELFKESVDTLTHDLREFMFYARLAEQMYDVMMDIGRLEADINNGGYIQESAFVGSKFKE